MKSAFLIGLMSIYVSAGAVTLPDNFMDMGQRQSEVLAKGALGDFIMQLAEKYTHDPIVMALINHDFALLQTLDIPNKDAEFTVHVPLQTPYGNGGLDVVFNYVSIALMTSFHYFLNGGVEDRTGIEWVLAQGVNPDKGLSAIFAPNSEGLDFGFFGNMAIRLFSDYSFYAPINARITPLGLVAATASVPLRKKNNGVVDVARLLLTHHAEPNARAKITQKSEKKGKENVMLESPVTAMAINAKHRELLELLFASGAHTNVAFFDGMKKRSLEDYTKEVCPEFLRIIRRVRKERKK